MKKLYLIIFLVFSTLLPAQILRITSTYSETDTVTTDTVSISTPSSTALIWRLDIVNVSTDSTDIEISWAANFTGARRLKPGQSFYYDDMSVFVFPTVYIRRKSASGNGIFDWTSLSF